MSDPRWHTDMLGALREWRNDKLGVSQLGDALVASLLAARDISTQSRAELEFWVLAALIAEDVGTDPSLRTDLEKALKLRREASLLGACDIVMPPPNAEWLPLVVDRLAALAERSGGATESTASASARIRRYRGAGPNLAPTEVVGLAREFCCEFGMLNRRRWPRANLESLPSAGFGIAPSDSFLTGIWPGTVTLGALEYWNWFPVTVPGLAALEVSLRTVCEFQDSVPAEDLCLWHRRGRPLLESVSHEAIWWLFLDDTDEAILRLKFPEIWSTMQEVIPDCHQD